MHVICALMNRRTIFPDPIALNSAYTRPLLKLQSPIKYADRPDPEYLSAFGIMQERGKFQCEYCKNSREGEPLIAVFMLHFCAFGLLCTHCRERPPHPLHLFERSLQCGCSSPFRVSKVLPYFNLKIFFFAQTLRKCYFVWISLP